MALAALAGSFAYRRQREGWFGTAIGHTWRGALAMLVLGVALLAAALPAISADLRPTGAQLLWRAKKNNILPVDQALPDGSYLSHLNPSHGNKDASLQSLPVRVVEYYIDGDPQAEPLIDYLGEAAEALREVFGSPRRRSSRFEVGRPVPRL